MTTMSARAVTLRSPRMIWLALRTLTPARSDMIFGALSGHKAIAARPKGLRRELRNKCSLSPLDARDRLRSDSRNTDEDRDMTQPPSTQQTGFRALPLERGEGAGRLLTCIELRQSARRSLRRKWMQPGWSLGRIGCDRWCLRPGDECEVNSESKMRARPVNKTLPMPRCGGTMCLLPNTELKDWGRCNPAGLAPDVKGGVHGWNSCPVSGPPRSFCTRSHSKTEERTIWMQPLGAERLFEEDKQLCRDEATSLPVGLPGRFHARQLRHL